MSEIENIKKLSNNLRKNILLMAKAGGSHAAHIGGALSIIDILATLYSKYFFLNKNSFDTDRFILSKGHACLAQYAILFEKEYIDKKDLETFEQSESKLLGHPVKNKNIGIEFSTGSLGMGLSLATGVAISLNKKKINRNVYVVLGDGECNEGSVWEAAMLIPKLKLKNLIVIIDKNNFQQTGSTDEILENKNMGEKWESFGWLVSEIDGHNFQEIIDSFNKIGQSEKPLLILAKTVKGKGVKMFEIKELDNDS
jgi:transketolase